MTKKHNKALTDLLEAAREIKRVHNKQRTYTTRLQELAAEARHTGKNLSHKLPQPALLDALDRFEAVEK